MTPIATSQALTQRERLKLGSTRIKQEVRPFRVLAEPRFGEPQSAMPKPWPNKEPDPFQGGDDGDGGPMPGTGEPFRNPPGEETNVPPSPSPSTDTLSLRASLDAAASTSSDPEVQQAMRAIEARLAEISLFLRTATRGASKDMAIKLGVLAHII